ncbi:MAG: ABC transporter ATP-binding protein [Mycoplasmatales bacterium]
MNLKLKDLSKNYQDLEVIKKVNLEIKTGELVSLLGPSGCGKSTILFMISGLETVTKGQILFDEKDVTNLSPDRRNIGLVFQNYALYPHLSVLKNVMYPLLNKKISKENAKKEALKVIKAVNLEKQINKKPAQLSGGQQQRVAIARAIAKKPEILLLDEPISNLDAKLKEKTIKEIRTIQKTYNITTIFVTHDQQEALAVSDKIVILDQGIIQQIGTPDELYKNPVNLYVAKFIGTPSINIIKVDIKDKKVLGLETIITEALEIPTGSYTLGVRPENIQINQAENIIEISESEILGRDILYRIKYKDCEFQIISRNNLEKSLKNIGIKISIKDIFLFDNLTGKRVY